MNIQIEFSNVCNLACVECPQHIMARKRQFMSDEVFSRVLEYITMIPDERKAKGYPPTVIFHKDGEPLLHPKIKEIVKTISAARPDFRFNIYTNGLKLTKDFIDLLDSLPNATRLLISYHFYDGDGKLNDYSKLDSLLKETFKEEHRIEFILTSHVNRFCSVEFLSKWQKGFEDLKGNIKTTPFVAFNTHINPWTDLIHEENCVVFDGCPYMDFGHLFIGVTGNVIPCCMDLEEELSMGNIMEDPYNRIFSRLERFYDRIKEKRNFEPLCLKCMKGSKYVEGIL